MGGNIKKDNARINLIVSQSLKDKIQTYAKKSGRSMSSLCLYILTDKTALRTYEDFNPFLLLDMSEEKEEGTARINLVVPAALKEELNNQAAEKSRSLNNYINTRLFVYFYGNDDRFESEQFIKNYHWNFEDPENENAGK